MRVLYSADYELYLGENLLPAVEVLVEPAAAGPAAYDRGAGRLEEQGESLASDDGHDTATLSGQGGRAGQGGVAEVRHADAVWPSGLDAGLDRGSDVVDMDVDVPGRLAADDNERVAEVGQR